jgi:hypothetical protein
MKTVTKKIMLFLQSWYCPANIHSLQPQLGYNKNIIFRKNYDDWLKNEHFKAVIKKIGFLP